MIPHKCGACGCSRPYRLTGLLESVHQSEGLRRDGAWEHAVFQQRAAGEAPLDESADVCVLMHVSVAQENTRMYQDRQRVSTANQVRDGCHMMPAYTI